MYIIFVHLCAEESAKLFGCTNIMLDGRTGCIIIVYSPSLVIRDVRLHNICVTGKSAKLFGCTNIV